MPRTPFGWRISVPPRTSSQIRCPLDSPQKVISFLMHITTTHFSSSSWSVNYRTYLIYLARSWCNDSCPGLPSREHRGVGVVAQLLGGSLPPENGRQPLIPRFQSLWPHTTTAPIHLKKGTTENPSWFATITNTHRISRTIWGCTKHAKRKRADRFSRGCKLSSKLF